MTYEEAARILMKYAKTVGTPSLQTAIEMGADVLFKRAAAEKAINQSEYAIRYSEDNPDGELVDISEKENNDGEDHKQK